MAVHIKAFGTTLATTEAPNLDILAHGLLDIADIIQRDSHERCLSEREPLIHSLELLAWKLSSEPYDTLCACGEDITGMDGLCNECAMEQDRKTGLIPGVLA